MAPPYGRGDTVAWLSIDPEGMRVHRAEVLGIEPEADGWRVSTTHGTEHVDMRGEGPALVPSDEEIATEFAQRGDGFLVRSTMQDIEQTLDRSIDWEALERNIIEQRNRDRHRGWSR
jgi:hypothetical protein